MPPQTRGSKTLKASKENIPVIAKTKSKAVRKVTKQRKALADKTNSASDDASSTEIHNNSSSLKGKRKVVELAPEAKSRPRRERKLPNRYNENILLSNLSNNKESDTCSNKIDVRKDFVENDLTISSPFKTPQKKIDDSLLVNRPKRVCRLPSKFDDHSVSPNKFIPIGCHASTPIIKTKKNIVINEAIVVLKNSDIVTLPINQKENNLMTENKKQTKVTTSKTVSDANNNAKQRQLRQKKLDIKNVSQFSPEKAPSTRQKTVGKKILQKSFSFRVLEDKGKPTKRDNSHLDVYEFTYDPNEEPPPQKKKRKRTVKKKPPKPKTVTFKYNYDHNVSKALVALKTVIAKKPTESQVSKSKINNQNNEISKQTTVMSVDKSVVPNASKQVAPKECTSTEPSRVSPFNQKPKPITSLRVEDIAADFEPQMDHDDMDYSPVTSPNRGKSPLLNTTRDNMKQHDPLNLQDNLSFFDDVPVASSSMISSIRRPHDSPWRVQFQQLPIKWHVNTYIKSNMTPAVESSFIDFNDSNKKKHVYTNLVQEVNDALPDIVSKDQPNLKQTSIISFYKEVAEKSASKKKRALSVTPTKASSVFEDVSNTSVTTPSKTPRTEPADNYWTPNMVQKEIVNKETNEDKENSSTREKNKRNFQTLKSKNKDKDGTFFGFDESEDQENISPVKINNPRVRALRPRARAVLQELNTQAGPTRAKIPLAAKTNIGAVNEIYEGMKSATDAPEFPVKVVSDVNAITNIEEQVDIQVEDAQSIHLFEDIDLVHHLKPLRKSYGKAKKVNFQQTTALDSDTESHGAPPQDGELSEEDDLADLTFTLPNVANKNVAKKKISKKKKQQSKKEKAELEAWAAQFNSMCEDVEEFPLVVE